jgi:hypothetical protein
MLRAQGRDLHGEFIGLLPSPPQPVSIQRWTLRRIGLMAGTALLAILLVTATLSMRNNDAATRTSLEIDALPAPTWSRCGCRPRPCPRRRWSRARGSCRSAGRLGAWPSTTAGR